MERRQESAFPVALQEGLSCNSFVDPGMSKRLYIASIAMQGILSGIYSNKVMFDTVRNVSDTQGIKITDYISDMAFDHADSLLKQEEL